MKSLQCKPLGLLACLAASGLAPVAVQANDGFYMGTEFGLNFVRSQNIDASPSFAATGKFKDGYAFGLTTGYAMPNGLRPELEVDYRRNTLDSLDLNVSNVDYASTDVGGHEAAYTVMGNLWYDVKSQDGLFSFVHPYIGGGVGWARVGLQDISATTDAPLHPAPFTPGVAFDNAINQYQNDFAWQLGTGLNFDITPALALSFDYRYLRTRELEFDTIVGVKAKSRYETNSVMIDLAYFFGKPTSIAAAPVPVAAVAPPPPAPPPPQEQAQEPAGPVDSDGDGVPDIQDKCPNTPRGFKVDVDGCITQQTVILQSVNFKTNSDELTESAQRKLDEVSAGLVGQPNLHVEIDGHTDSRGTRAHNEDLSQHRAESVRKYLVSNGVNGDNLTARGFGFDKPIASNATEEGRAQNRRVEFVVANPPPDVKVMQKDAPAQ
jgi:OOP family OmpA-OmpF porin